ncbi:hypothetical protein WNZ14_21335 [Hoeflea sp. AS60]|uniref:hypothetical protein n=1 Tax=Hoeflea sp. AS60 TaxID=3135780 RepID=UPI0031804A6C
MGKYYSEEDIELFIGEWRKQFPEGFEEALSILREGHGFSDDEFEPIQNKAFREIHQVAKVLPFFATYREKNGGGAQSDLIWDVYQRLFKLVSLKRISGESK